MNIKVHWVQLCILLKVIYTVCVYCSYVIYRIPHQLQYTMKPVNSSAEWTNVQTNSLHSYLVYCTGSSV